jgi:hypothetical protein
MRLIFCFILLAYIDELAAQLDVDDKQTHLCRRGLGVVDIINTVNKSQKLK